MFLLRLLCTNTKVITVAVKSCIFDVAFLRQSCHLTQRARHLYGAATLLLFFVYFNAPLVIRLCEDGRLQPMFYGRKPRLRQDYKIRYNDVVVVKTPPRPPASFWQHLLLSLLPPTVVTKARVSFDVASGVSRLYLSSLHLRITTELSSTVRPFCFSPGSSLGYDRNQNLHHFFLSK